MKKLIQLLFIEKYNSNKIMNILVLVVLVQFSFQVSAKKSFNFNYTDWKDLSTNDKILMQYKPNLEEVLNVQINSSALYQIQNFTSATTNGMPIFNYNVTVTLIPTTAQKQHRYAEFEKYTINSPCASCLLLFNINPWVKIFNVTKLECD